tara:strand:+ start:990 stop:1187 length:198 start_codon:yes stop_codon:yes gene_type:complete
MFSYSPSTLVKLSANQELKKCFSYLRKNDIEPTEKNIKELIKNNYPLPIITIIMKQYYLWKKLNS